MTNQATGCQPGFVEWFRVGEYERVELALADLKLLGVKHLRTAVSWADYYRKEGCAWYDWLIPKLAAQVEILPCFTYTPPSLGIEARTASPPRDTKAFADFIDFSIDRYGKHFEYIELWNEPNNRNDWDYRLDPGWNLFTDMMSKAAYWCRKRGYKTVLGGMAPTDPSWLELMGQRELLSLIDVVGLHGFPGTWDYDGFSWKRQVESVLKVARSYNEEIQLWVTEAGYSTWRHDEARQIAALVEILDIQVPRTYLYQLHDLHPDLPHQDGLREDVKHYHFGIRSSSGDKKLAFRFWEQGGVDELRGFVTTFDHALQKRSNPRRIKPAVIVGGAGFIGTNMAARLCREGESVRIFDNLKRPGVENNLRWLMECFPRQVEAEIADLRDALAIRQAVQDASMVFHFGAQVAVTTSELNPQHDFFVNMCGTFNLLEALRTVNPVPLLFTSTNKVYGKLNDLRVKRAGDRYVPEEGNPEAIDESMPLDFCSPYGCSKGGADQYVLDYAHTYDLPALVFRMSCIYGPHQWGTEDQGWVAHFLNRALQGQSLTLYGDGAQVRDILYVDDLTEAMLRAMQQISRTSGKAFNIGGGLERSVSLLELFSIMKNELNLDVRFDFDEWRTGDQRYYVTNTSRLRKVTGWAPRVSVKDGLGQLLNWMLEQPELTGNRKSSVGITPQPIPVTAPVVCNGGHNKEPAER